MSSEQFAEHPLPPEKERCPKCGQLMAPGALSCEACQAQFVIAEGLPEVTPRELPATENEAKSGWLIWVIAAFIVVMVGLFAVLRAPELLCIAVLVPAPLLALLDRGQSKALGGAAWLGCFAVLLILLSGFIAFAVYCTPMFGQWPPARETREGEK